MLKQDENGRVACECLTTRGLIFIAGEITTNGYVDIPVLARDLLKSIGYLPTSCGFNSNSSAIITSIQNQSPDIALGVNKGGAGDQGMMFGYATDETEQLMPMPITLAHKLVRRLSEIRKTGELDYLRPDGKSQVTVLYKDGKPENVNSVVLSAQPNHESIEKIKGLTELVIRLSPKIEAKQ